MYFSRVKLNLIRLFYLLFFIFPALLLWVERGMGLSVYSIGQLLGIWALTALALQFVLSSRLKFLERRIGLDRVMSLHSFNAKFMLTVILFHPAFIFAKSLLGGMSIMRLINTFTVYHWLGEINLLLVIMVLITTLYSKKLKLNYEHWKLIHKTGYLIVAIGFLHSYSLGADIIVKNSLYYWWLFLGFIALAGFLARRYKIWIDKKEYIVVENKQEAPNVRTITLKPTKGEPFSFLPGQFAFLNLYSNGLSPEEHHFTISSRPGEKTISFTPKAVGDYTSQLDKVKKGDRAKIDGPYGAFTARGVDKPVLFIAGGIGITPVMSMLRENRVNKHLGEVTLIYSIPSKDEAVFQKELEEINREKWFTLVYVLTKQKTPKGIKGADTYFGRLNQKILKKYLKDRDAKIFIVGPEAFMDAAKKMLIKDMSVKSKNILTERFALR